jgi:hypothetical protein
MAKDYVATAGRRYRQVMKTSEKRYDAFVQETPEAQPEIHRVRGALTNMVKICRASSKLNGHDADWVKIMDEVEEVKIAACEELDGQEFFTALPECYTSTQLRMLNSLQFSTEEDKPSKHPHAPQPTPQAQQQKQTTVPASRSRRKRSSSSEDSAAPSGTKKREKPAEANPVHQPEQEPSFPTRNYFAPLRAISMDTEEAETPEAVTSEGSIRKPERPPQSS